MNKDIVLTLVELGASTLLEGVILAMIFNWISNRSQERQRLSLQSEMNNIEKQNKFDFQQLQAEIRLTKQEVISQIKEKQDQQKETKN